MNIFRRSEKKKKNKKTNMNDHHLDSYAKYLHKKANSNLPTPVMK